MTWTPSRRTPVPVVLLAIFTLGFLALPALAEVYHVNLANGTKFDSRYPPEEASWDANTLLFITEGGNWIGIARDQITSVEAEVETRGHGKRINATTIYMGRAPNANQTPEEQEAAAKNPQLQMLQKLINQQSKQPDYTVEQFVDPGQAGKGGLPAGYGGVASPVTTGPTIAIPTPTQAPSQPPQ